MASTGQDSPAAPGGDGGGPLGPVKREAHELAEHARSSAETIAEETAGFAADYVWALAAAARTGADELNERHHGRCASIVRQAAEDCDRFARTLTEQGPDRAVSNVTEFANRHPVMFLGATVLAGIGIVQLLGHLDERRD